MRKKKMKKTMKTQKILKILFIGIIFCFISFVSSCTDQSSDIAIDDGNETTVVSDGFIERKLLLKTIISRSSYGGHTEEKEYVIKDNTEWTNFWGVAYSSLSPQPEIPAINFEEEMVIAVFQGIRPSGGYSIKITQILEKENFIEVSVEETIPSPGSATVTVITNPSHIVKTERSDKEVIFIKSTEFT